MTDPHVAPIESFRDAVGFALELADRHAFIAAAVLLGSDGRPLDMATSNGLGAGIEPVVAWAAGIGDPPGRRRGTVRPRRALLVSVRSFDPETIREADLRRYREARWSFARTGCDLIDWIETDGDLFRSYAYVTCPAGAWWSDPPGHRLVDGGWA